MDKQTGRTTRIVNDLVEELLFNYNSKNGRLTKIVDHDDESTSNYKIYTIIDRRIKMEHGLSVKKENIGDGYIYLRII